MGGKNDHSEITPSAWAAFTTYFGYAVLFVFGFMREAFASVFKPSARPPAGYAPLKSGHDDFFTRRMYHRIQDCWNRPVTGCPGVHMDVMERESINYNKVLGYGFNKALRVTGKTKRCLNLGSYNYAGFGDPNSPCKPSVLKALRRYGIATCSTMTELGTTELHLELERTVCEFVGKPAAMIFGMGFGVNACAIPAVAGPGSLIISDEYNHSSIVTGARASGAKVAVFSHNDEHDLEAVVRKAIVDGQPRTHRPWRRIWVIVEATYSMEATSAPLKAICELKRKYGFYLWLDEAHSFGAVGATGRGLCEHTGVDPRDVDIMMATYSKSTGAVGGHIAASREIIAAVRARSAGTVYSSSLAPAAVQQVISALNVIRGADGTDIGAKKLRSLHENSRLFRRLLRNAGFKILGSDENNSAVIPIMLFSPSKIPCFSRMCLEQGLALVVVGYPATPLLTARARICVSAGHTREDLETAAAKLEAIGRTCGLLYNRSAIGI